MFQLRIISQLTRSLKRTMASTESDVLFETVNNTGVVTLNRPAVGNAANTSVLSKILHKLQEWENYKHLVLIKGNDKVFCAGADFTVTVNPVNGPSFFQTEYNVNYLIGKYKIPYIALMNGVALGGGLGLAIHGRYRIATEKTVIALPETKLGVIPDVGLSYFLPRLEGNIGWYLGLTGDRLKGKDVVKAGIATHFVPDKRLYELEKLLSRCQNNTEVESLLSKFNEPLDEFSLAPNIKHINYCFAASTVEEIIERLEKVQNEWSVKTLKTLHQMCPHSLKITIRALQRGAQLDLPQVLRMEYRLALRVTKNCNYPEGLRAFLIEKDNNPQWKPNSLAEVTDDYVEEYFKNLPEDQELKFFDDAQH